jgi:hypothetical protein
VDIRVDGLYNIDIDVKTHLATINLTYSNGFNVRLIMPKEEAKNLADAMGQAFTSNEPTYQEYEEYKAQMKEYGCEKMMVPFDVWKAHRDFEAITKKTQEAKG